MKPQVCAVIVTYNRKDLLAVCLKAVLAQARMPEQVLVVDNASTDGTADFLTRQPAPVDVLRLATNQGGAGGFEAGMKEAAARGFDWVWIMDDDVAPRPDCLGVLLEVAARTAAPAVVPRRLDVEGHDLARECRIDEAAQRYESVRADPDHDEQLPIDLFTFEGPLLQKKTLQAVGFPNPNLFIGADDTLYAVRLYRKYGLGASVLAVGAVMQKLRPRDEGVRVRSRWKKALTGRAEYQLFDDARHWKQVYTFRNRHLLWKALGWSRRRRRYALLHLGYIFADLFYAWRHGWHWPRRLRWNVTAWVLGLMGKDRRFGVERMKDIV